MLKSMKRCLAALAGLVLMTVVGCGIDHSPAEDESVHTSAVRSAATYYVSSSTGNDANDGLTAATAWKTLNRVNTNPGGFIGGDQILLKAGDQWNSSTTCGGVCQLWPKGSVTSAPYIKIDMFGTGAKPKIVGAGAGEWCGGTNADNTQGAVYLESQSGWEIRDLDVSNIGGTQPSGVRCQVTGIKVRNPGTIVTTTRHIYIGNNDVHDVTGIISGWHGANTGIAVTADIQCTSPSCAWIPTWSDVTVENNTVTSVDRVGIFVGPNWMDYPSWSGAIDTDPHYSPNWLDGVAIAGNKLDDIGGDGILSYVSKNVTVSGNTVSNSGSRTSYDFDNCNAAQGNPSAYNGTHYINCNSVGIWTGWSDNTTIELNEVYSYGWPGAASGVPVQYDGEAFDADVGSTNLTFEYNYSHSNFGGTFQIDYDYTDNLTFRYNVIANDGMGTGWTSPWGPTALFRLQAFGGSQSITGANPPDIDNNLIFIGPTQPATPVFSDGLPSGAGAAWVYNNIFYALAPDSYPSPFSGNIQFSNDLYSEVSASGRPSDSNGLIADPLIANPTGFNSGFAGATGFRLAPGSPAIISPGANSGYLGSRDFWGNPVAAPPALPNRGPYNGSGVSLTNSLLWRGSVAAYSGSGCNAGTEPSATISTSSAYESVSWARVNLVDGQEYSANNSSGYSSQLGQICSDKNSPHHEWVSVCTSTSHSFSKIVLYPRNDRGEVGEAFPIDFHVDTWQGSGALAHWVTWASQTNVPKPTGPVTVASTTVTSNCVRIVGTNLRFLSGAGYVMEFAEIEAYP